MSFTGLAWQTWTIALGQGQDQKSDPRALRSPALAKAIDVQFEDVDGLQTRYPFASSLIGADIFGGGSLADIRRVEPNGDELLCFTKDTLYSWNAQQSAWISRGTHLAVKVDEQPRFIAPGEQADCDRAELDGLVVYAWTETLGSSGSAYVAAIDKATGAVTMSPTSVGVGVTRPRLVALSTKILLFTHGVTGATTDLVARALDPADPSAGLASTTTVLTSAAGFNSYFDVVKVAGADQAVFAARRNPTTSYEVGTVTAGLTVAKSTKARTCDGPIAVSCTPDGASVQVVRTNSTNVQGDLITIATLADVYTAQAIGTTLGSATNQIAAAHRSVQNGGQYRCYVFWDASESDTPSAWQCKTNWVDTGNSLGSEDRFLYRLGVASRAFDHDGSVYVWGAFAGASGVGYRGFGSQLQDTYFLYRDDGFLCAKAAWQRAGGFAQSTGCLPGVASTDTNEYAWCGVERRIIPLGPASKGYADRGPHDVVFTFDSNEARRVARLGRTLYIACGEGVLQYDGRGLYEVGAHTYPWNYVLGAVTGSGGDVEDGTYAAKPTFRWDNAQGEIDRSTTATTGSIEMSGGPGLLTVSNIVPLHITHKTNVAVELWRTKVNPTDDAPFFLVTSKDPTSTANPNRYLSNDPDTTFIASAAALDEFEDELSDDDAGALENNPENGLALESLAPPAASIIYATDTRLFLAGVSGDPDRVWYSKQRGDGEIAAFNDALVASVPPEGGDITAIWVQQDALVVAREHAIYVLPGQGYSNVGDANGSQNYGPARKVPGNVGCESQEAFAVTDRGAVFKSSKGWQLLDNGFNVHYIGAAFADYDDEEVLAVHDMKSQHQVRALTASRMLVFDTLLDPWRCAEWTVADGVHACMWNGSHVYASATTVLQQQTTYTGLDYGFDIETAWIQFPDGCIKVDQFQVLGEYRSTHRLRIRCARDHWKDGEDVFFQDKTWTVSPTTVGARLKVKHSPSNRSVEALKIRLSARGLASSGVYASDTFPGAHPETPPTYEITATAKTIGTTANGWTVTLTSDGTGTGTWDDGQDAEFHYESGVTTMADLIAAAAASLYFTITGSGTIDTATVLTLADGAGATEDTKPTGEAARLTSIQFELGFERGLNRQLPTAQKQ